MNFKTNFVRHDPVRKICALATGAISIRIVEEGFEFAQPAESPIEEVFGTAICAHYRYIETSSRFKIWPQDIFDEMCHDLEAKECLPYVEYDVLAASQYQTDGARTDFIFAHKNWRKGNVFRLVVECDGHDWLDRKSSER